MGRLKFFSRSALIRSAVVAGLLIGVVLANAQSVALSGVKKDAVTGFTTKYNTMIPAKAYMSMNGEVLNHNDVPMGESFLIVNEKVSGLVKKNGKVSVGCSLMIADKKGKKLVNMADMFKGKDIFTPEEASKLKCTVPTAKLTGWEEKYDVVVTFWDKYGNGSIVNKVRIRMIDMP